MNVGVLSVQGAFQEHIDMLESLGVNAVQVRLPEDLENLDALILPGGESTAMAKLLEKWNLLQPLRQWVIQDKKPIWGTCAGMILLSDSISGGEKLGGQVKIGGLDAKVHRNIFGAQIRSFETQLNGPPGFQSKPYDAVFIRAPALSEVGPEVTVLEQIKENQVIVAARQDNILVTSFHPELTRDTRWHEYFLTFVSGRSSVNFLNK